MNSDLPTYVHAKQNNHRNVHAVKVEKTIFLCLWVPSFILSIVFSKSIFVMSSIPLELLSCFFIQWAPVRFQPFIVASLLSQWLNHKKQTASLVWRRTPQKKDIRPECIWEIIVEEQRFSCTYSYTKSDVVILCTFLEKSLTIA